MTMSPPSPASDHGVTWIGGLGGQIEGLPGYAGVQGLWRPPPSIDLNTPRPEADDGSDSDVAFEVASSPGQPGEDDEDTEDDKMVEQASHYSDDEDEDDKVKIKCLPHDKIIICESTPEQDDRVAQIPKDSSAKIFSKKGLSRFTIFDAKMEADLCNADLMTSSTGPE